MTSSKSWQIAVSHTHAKSPGSFTQWFSGVALESFSSGTLCLRACDPFVREWVEAHFLPTLVGKLKSETGLDIQVTWTIGSVCDLLDAPLTEGVLRSVAAEEHLFQSPPSSPSCLPPFQSSPFSSQTSSSHSSASPPPSSSPIESQASKTSLHPAPFSSARVDVAPRQPQSYQSYQSYRPHSSSPPSSMLRSVEGLNAKYTFSNFVMGPSNQLAHAAALSAAGGPGGVGPRHNPLFLCGATGLGKTHLVHAVAHRIRESNGATRIIYLSAEQFVNEFVQALQDGRMHEFRSRFRDKCDVLLIDDIQFLASKTQTQEEFFHVFNTLHQSGKTILLTSDKYPSQLERMEERLVSRFAAGLVADIQGPELETRIAILRKKASLEGIELDSEVGLLIAQTIRTNVRELEGTLIRLAAKSSLLGQMIDLEFAKQELFVTGALRNQETSVDDIQRAVCHHFKLKTSDLNSKDRHRTIAFARHVAMYLCKQRLRCSLPELGRAFGGRDHSTVLSAIRKVDVLRESSPEVRAHLDVLEKKIGVSS